jgi:hypothetical protein
MKKHFFTLAALALLFSCTPENNNGGETQNNPDKLTVTGDALEVTDWFAKLTGYANLSVEWGDADVGIMYDKVKSFENAQKVVATGLDGNNKFIVTAIGLDPGTIYYYKSYVQKRMAVEYGVVKSFRTKEPESFTEAVDMGFEMTRKDGTTYKLYWAKSNLGENGLCAKIEDYGDYYAWGETAPKENYFESTYKWSNGPELTKYNTMSSYGRIDRITELQRGDNPGETIDDVARAKLGDKWRMPTYAEWSKLKTNCTWICTTLNGVDGYKVTGPNGNSIFLPAAGYRQDRYLEMAGSTGYYWSSSLYTRDPRNAYYVGLYSSDIGIGPYVRSHGLSVRPVTE